MNVTNRVKKLARKYLPYTQLICYQLSKTKVHNLCWLLIKMRNRLMFFLHCFCRGKEVIKLLSIFHSSFSFHLPYFIYSKLLYDLPITLIM